MRLLLPKIDEIGYNFLNSQMSGVTTIFLCVINQILTPSPKVINMLIPIILKLSGMCHMIYSTKKNNLF